MDTLGADCGAIFSTVGLLSRHTGVGSHMPSGFIRMSGRSISDGGMNNNKSRLHGWGSSEQSKDRSVRHRSNKIMPLHGIKCLYRDATINISGIS